MAKVNRRADHSGPHRTVYEKNRIRILKTQNICAICGRQVDTKLKTPNPMAPEIDHIIPVSKNGHPSDINNLQLVHRSCNQLKSDSIYKEQPDKQNAMINSNRNLPQSMEWTEWRVEDEQYYKDEFEFVPEFELDTELQKEDGDDSDKLNKNAVDDDKSDWTSMDLLRGYQIRK